MEILSEIWGMIYGTVLSFTWSDLIDILAVSYLIYKAIQISRETQAAQLIKGVFLLLIISFISAILNLKTINLLLTNLFNWALLALIVLFQPEIRRILEKAGRTRVRGYFSFFNYKSQKNTLDKDWDKCFHVIGNACESMAKTYTGALIVIERITKLGEQLETGIIIDAKPSKELLCNLFFKNSPLHDGAVIIRDARVLAASCFLPKPQKEELLGSDLGSRHRAAIGMSEHSDAIVIIVSEETGSISVAENGKLKREFSKTSLITFLKDRIYSDAAVQENAKKPKHKRRKSNEAV